MIFKEPWYAIYKSSADNGQALVQEAETEIPHGHALSGKALIAIARRGDRDDVLFQADGGPNVAIVHLTWSGKKERPGRPSTQVFSSVADFIASRMEADHFDFV